VSRVVIVLLSLWVQTPVLAAKVTLAVAANFTAPMKQLVRHFEDQTGHQTVVSSGSTGKLYAQILNGAPFDIFLAADQERPLLLHRAGLAQAPKTYAIGRLVLWSKDQGLIAGDPAVLTRGDFARLAIANPKTAPYGVAAMQIIEALGQRQALEPKLVRGDNIAQTYQFVMSGNAQLGFVAASQVNASDIGSRWVPPPSLYQPIRQDAVLLNRGKNKPAALAFMAFLDSAAARQIADRHGYAKE